MGFFSVILSICLVLAEPGTIAVNPVSRTLSGTYSGSPFFDDNYKYADIIFSKARKFTNVKTRIDLEIQAVQFISNNGIEALLEPGMVKEVSYADTTAEGILFYKFRTGYPAFENKTLNQFYIVLADGNCSLLRVVEKHVSQRKNDISGAVIKDYETSDSYYLFVKGEMKRLKKDKDAIMTELADKQEQITQFAQANKINFRNIDQLAKLINYYNTL